MWAEITVPSTRTASEQARTAGRQRAAAEVVALRKSVWCGAAEGGRVDAAQEMVTLGLCNLAGGLVRAMPTCGAFTRSAVAHSSGVRTPAAGLYAGAPSLCH